MSDRSKEQQKIVSFCPPSISFSGSAWGCIYQIGALQGLEKRYRHHLKNSQWAGISAGSVIALGASLGKSADTIQKAYEELRRFGKAYGSFGKMSIYHEMLLTAWLPDNGEEYLSLYDKLHVGILRPINDFVWISQWSSNTDVKNSIHASMHIPFMTTHTDLFRERLTLDPGFLKNTCLLDKNTLTISPVTRAHIYGGEKFSFFEIFSPPTYERSLEMFEAGQQDTLSYWSPSRASAQCQNDTGGVRLLLSLAKAVFRFFFPFIGWTLRCAEHLLTLASIQTRGVLFFTGLAPILYSILKDRIHEKSWFITGIKIFYNDLKVRFLVYSFAEFW